MYLSFFTHLCDGNMLLIHCPHCKAKAVTTSSDQQTDTVKRLYCSCSNEKCRWSGVFNLSYSHDISPPVGSDKAQAQAVMARLSPQDRAEVVQQFTPESSAAGH
jgi:hypothetical protein